MEELKETCKKILILLDKEFPNQQYYAGVVKNIRTIVENIYSSVLSGEAYKEKINFNSLIREFVDETTHFSSPVIPELEKLDRLLS
ncbi:hypothetical protein HRG49_01525 [Enterococcus faecalis]|jgi:hypothetical protein|uniref:hypothetical protein n=1 Tax=Enterococcus TaxID=1350 RepID=UPI0006616AB0|nr:MULTISPECIES: hypothetical protein [Enterococcus]EGO2826338.1 hypothetical protein [Enterococcus faecalis]EGO7552726.1 hypothetical protein [Enterococcus faecalis]EGO9397187.1 hypothetical protein [Enterococcus faecalis]EGS7941925.1 hypothetical protein [Enterococcus faecalis]EHB6471164.1 hypothetical protein [Enterococcus faecalis]